MGDSTAPLLRIVDVRLNMRKTIMHTIINTPLFVPIQKKSFDTIQIWIMTDTGEPAPFSDGKSNVVLEFKKIRFAGQLGIKWACMQRRLYFSLQHEAEKKVSTLCYGSR